MYPPRKKPNAGVVFLIVVATCMGMHSDSASAAIAGVFLLSAMAPVATESDTADIILIGTIVWLCIVLCATLPEDFFQNVHGSTTTLVDRAIMSARVTLLVSAFLGGVTYSSSRRFMCLYVAAASLLFLTPVVVAKHETLQLITALMMAMLAPFLLLA